MTSCPVKDLLTFVPHRGPAVWVDAVLNVDENGGVCRVDVKEDGRYLTDGVLRPSSYVEFIAQAYGFVSACQNMSGIGQDIKKLSRAYLVGVKNLELPRDVSGAARKVAAGDTLIVKVRRSHELPPLYIVDGEVYRAAGDKLESAPVARAQIKLFATAD